MSPGTIWSDEYLAFHLLHAFLWVAVVAGYSVLRTRDRLVRAGIPTTVQLPNLRKILSLSYNSRRGHGKFLERVQQAISRESKGKGVVGSVFPIYPVMGGLPVVNIGHHKAARAVLRSTSTSKSFMYGGFSDLTGRATFSVDGSEHAKKRFALLHTVFGGKAMEGLEGVVNRRVDAMATRLEADCSAGGVAEVGGVDVAEAMLQLTVGNIWEYLCGRPLGATDAPEVAQYIGAQVQMRKVVWAHSCSLWFLSRWCYRHFSSLHRTERRLMDVMRRWGRRCQQAALPGSPLARLAEEGAVLERAGDLDDEVRLLLFAGSDTTGGTAAWVLHLLSQHPDVMDRLRRELRQHLAPGAGVGEGEGEGEAPGVASGGGAKGDHVGHEQVSGCAYLDAVVREAQRMYPVAPMVARVLGEDVDIGGKTTIPAGTAAQLWIWALHNDPEVWGDPAVFRPGRWLGKVTDDQRASFMPFSTGPRNCAGQRFATVALRIVVARLVGRFRLEAVSPGVGKMAPMCVGFTMLPGTRVGVRFVPWEHDAAR